MAGHGCGLAGQELREFLQKGSTFGRDLIGQGLVCGTLGQAYTGT